MNRPQHEITVHPGLLPGQYREVVAHLGGQLLDLGCTGLTLNPLHPGPPVGEPKQARETR